MTKISAIKNCFGSSASFYDNKLIHTACDLGADNYQSGDNEYTVVGDEIFISSKFAKYSSVLGGGLSVETNDGDAGFDLKYNYLLCKNSSSCQGIDDSLRITQDGYNVPEILPANAPLVIAADDTVYDEASKRTHVNFLVYNQKTKQVVYLQDKLRGKRQYSNIRPLRVNSDGSFAYMLVDLGKIISARYFDGTKFKKVRRLNKRFSLTPIVRADGTILSVGRDISFTSHVVLQKGRNIRKLALPRGKFYREADKNIIFWIENSADDGLTLVFAAGKGKRKFFYYENDQPKKLKKPKGEKWRNLRFVDMTACGDIMFINDKNGTLYVYKRSACSDT